MKQITKESCDELSGIDFSGKTPDELKISMGLALVKVAGKHQEELQAIGVNLSDPQTFGPLGRDIGIQLAASCPSFVSTLTKNANLINDALQNGKGPTTGTLSGKLLSIVEGDLTYLRVEDSNGKIEKLWWLEYFEGSNKLVGNAARQLNQPIKVSYVEKEVFNAVLKDYVKIKIITRLE